MKLKAYCPMMGVQESWNDNGIRKVSWVPKMCIREKCGVWTRYGCGLSHNITIHAKAVTPDE